MILQRAGRGLFLRGKGNLPSYTQFALLELLPFIT